MTEKPEPEVTQPPRFPDITVTITGRPGAMFADMQAIRRALHNAGHPDQVPNFVYRAMEGNHRKFLATCREWVTIKIN